MASKKNAAKPAAAKSTKTPSTEFSLHAPEAQEVYVVGDFNDWNQTAAKMRRFKDGTCKKSIQLKPGRYEYLFLVDGQWWTDPQNGDRACNSYGSENSVITVA